jgi:hypothetical protein
LQARAIPDRLRSPVEGGATKDRRAERFHHLGRRRTQIVGALPRTLFGELVDEEARDRHLAFPMPLRRPPHLVGADSVTDRRSWRGGEGSHCDERAARPSLPKRMPV